MGAGIGGRCMGRIPGHGIAGRMGGIPGGGRWYGMGGLA